MAVAQPVYAPSAVAQPVAAQPVAQPVVVNVQPQPVVVAVQPGKRHFPPLLPLPSSPLQKEDLDPSTWLPTLFPLCR